jgi:hypothetical protein
MDEKNMTKKELRREGLRIIFKNWLSLLGIALVIFFIGITIWGLIFIDDETPYNFFDDEEFERLDGLDPYE